MQRLRSECGARVSVVRIKGNNSIGGQRKRRTDMNTDGYQRLPQIVGDVVEMDDSPADAMERYCGLMEDWIAAVRDGTSLQDVFPVLK